MKLEPLERLLKIGGADEIELSAISTRCASTRFSGSAITQAAALTDPVVQARVAVGKRIGVARDVAPTEALIRRALELARVSPEQPHFAGFADPAPYPSVPNSFYAQTAALTCADHTRALETIFLRAARHGLACAGAYKSGTTEIAVANSRGVRAHHEQSFAKLDVIAASGDASGYATFYGADAGTLEAAELAERASEKAVRMRDPLDLEPGEYDVVLEPPAVVESLEWMAMTAFGAREVEQGQSFLAGRKPGEELTGPHASWFDDAIDIDRGVPALPFDSEGTPKQRVMFVDCGRAGGPCHDLRTAARAGVRSTGHAPAPGDELDGPFSTHVQMAAGEDSFDDLVAEVERGLLVTRFHYVNGLLDTRRALQTGMTRDGLFLIDQGKVTRGVRNLRWTEPMLEAFTRMDGATRDRQAVGTSWTSAGAFIAPAVLIRGFHFTGRSR
jgi:predicted Zn-dependent protease